MAELLEFDPTSEDAANSPLSVMTSSYRVTSHSYPAPQLNVLYASSVDTEGELPASRRYSNRVISMSIEMVDATGSLTRALQAKMAKIAREGGTLKRTLATGQVIVFDLVSSEQFDPTFDVSYYSGNLTTVNLQLGAKPFGRGTPVTLTSHSETTLPCLVFTETGVTGDVPALGKLVISDAQAVDQWFVMWGIESRNYSSATTAALFYEAEGRTGMSGAATAVGPTGASGAGSNVMRHTDLSPGYQAVLSTQTTGGGSHLSHIGAFQVWARVQVPTTNAGTVSVALQWAEADLSRWTQNSDVAIDPSRNGTWALVNLGQVSLSKAVQGTQRWEGRVLASSSASGDDIDIDSLFLVPVAEGYGEVRGVVSTAAPTTFIARDEFNQTAGAVVGKTLPVGGTWAGTVITAPGTTDFTVDATSHLLTRTGFVGERIVHNGTNYTTAAAQVDMLLGSAFSQGLILRFVDASNFLALTVTTTQTIMYKRVAGTNVYLTTTNAPGPITNWMTYRVFVDTVGRWAVYSGLQGGSVNLLASGQHAELATGGVLATGKIGPYDLGTNGNPRSWDNFRIWSQLTDPAMFASQSLEVRHDQVLRESSDGTGWRAASLYEGTYLRVPPAGAEGRTLRVMVKASRNDPYNAGADSSIDDITAQLTYTPRFLVIP